jgi:hypothetical protein
MPRTDKENDLKRLNAFADEMELDGDDRDDFITSSMVRLGYKVKKLLDFDLDDEKNDDSGDFFSRRRNTPKERDVKGRGNYANFERRA